MGKEFWEDTVLTTAYILKRSQSNLLKDKTPFELWSGEKPNIHNMKIFGCIAYAKVPDSIRSKLDDNDAKRRFVGYSQNGYRLWNLRNNELIHSRNVLLMKFQVYCRKC